MVKWKKIIVVLYAENSTGFLATTLKENIEAIYPDYAVVNVEQEKIQPPTRSKFNSRMKIFGLRHVGWMNKLVSKFHRFSNNKRIRSERRDLKKRVDETKRKSNALNSAKKMVNLINRLQPEIIICMIPEVIDLCIEAKRQTTCGVRIICNVNDFSLDKYYISYNVDAYLVNHYENRKALMKYGISEDKIIVTGMPSQKKSILELDKDAILEKYDINNKLPIVVLDGGYYGYYYTKENFLVLSELSRDFNLLVLAGGNKSLRRAFAAAKKQDAEDDYLNLYITDEREETEVLRIADIYITPPNPMVIYNAFELNIPVIMTAPITSNERTNYRYITKKGYTIPCRNSTEIVDALSDLLGNKNALAETVTKAKEYINYVKDFRLPEDGSFLTKPEGDPIKAIGTKK